MKKHIVDFHWHKGISYIVTRDLKTGGLLKTKLLDCRFNVRFPGKRFCPGTYSLDKWEYGECKEKKELTGTKYHRCKSCEDKIGFRGAFLFNGEVLNLQMKKYLSLRHYLYLAYFSPNIIKVGTTSKRRKLDRLYEQDARNFCFIAETVGFDIQSIERYISKTLHLRESVPLVHKFKYLCVVIDQVKAKQELRDTFRKIKKILKGTEFENWLFKKAEFYELKAVQEGISLINTEWIRDFKELGGRVVSVRGRLIILENNGNIFAIDGKQLVGEIVEDVREKIVLNSSKEQIGLI